jgi:hypothetical protein
MRHAPWRTLRLGLVSIVCAGSLVAACPSIASVRSHRLSNPVVLHPKWHLVSRSTAVLQSSGPYVLLDSGQPSAVGLVIDNQTGKRIQAPQPCPYEFGGGPSPWLADPWLLYMCGSQQQPDVRLYSLTQNSWLDVPTPQPVRDAPPCSSDGDFTCYLSVTTGRYWLRWTFACGMKCDQASYPEGYSNIQTGTWRSSTPVSGTYDDPNAKGLSVKPCGPLHVRPGASLIQLGRFRLLDQDAIPGPSYLVRCGSHFRRRLLGGASASDSHMVLVGATGTNAHELLLPTLRPFQLTTPPQPSPGPEINLYLSDHTLYAGLPPRVWTTPEDPILRGAQRKTEH